jgi:hypothetical protein
MARTLPGVRPIISRASSPTATSRLSSSLIATTLGSLDDDDLHALALDVDEDVDVRCALPRFGSSARWVGI